MSNIINRTQRDADGALLEKYSVNTPDYSTDDWLIDPDLSGVSGVAKYYWKVTGTPPSGAVEEMNQSEKDAVDASRLATAKTNRKQYFDQRSSELILQQYKGGAQQFISLYTDAFKVRPNRKAYLQTWINWLSEISTEIANKAAVVDAQTTVEAVNAVVLDEATILSNDPGVDFGTAISTSDDTTVQTFLDVNAVVTDSTTGISGPWNVMQTLEQRKDLYNDSDNPIYDASHTPILGSGGFLVDHADRINNLETIHAKLGWHNQEVVSATYSRPKDLLFYYGYPNSFNNATNGYDNEKVAQDMAKYGIVVLGDGVQDPSHPDYSNTSVIIPRIKALHPSTLVFGYVASAQTIGNFETKVDQWDTLEVHGIFMDESGYDYSVSRSDFNTRVDYVHGTTYAKLAFANAWNTDHILGTTNDPSYPNSTWNPSTVESNLTTTDWILLESFAINTTAYSGNSGYESGSQWAARGSKMQTLRATYGVNFAGVGIINNGNASGGDLFDFGFTSALMFSLESYGTSDTNYGSGGTVDYWTRPDVSGMGVVWCLNAAIQVDVNDSDVYHRYSETAKMSVDFSSSAQTSSITKT